MKQLKGVSTRTSDWLLHCITIENLQLYFCQRRLLYMIICSKTYSDTCLFKSHCAYSTLMCAIEGYTLAENMMRLIRIYFL